MLEIMSNGELHYLLTLLMVLLLAPMLPFGAGSVRKRTGVRGGDMIFQEGHQVKWILCFDPAEENQHLFRLATALEVQAMRLHYTCCTSV